MEKAQILDPKTLSGLPLEKLQKILETLDRNRDISETEYLCAMTSTNGESHGMTAKMHSDRLQEVLTESMLVREAIAAKTRPVVVRTACFFFRGGTTLTRTRGAKDEKKSACPGLWKTSPRPSWGQ